MRRLKLLILLLILSAAVPARPKPDPGSRQVDQWFNSNKWASGMTLKPYPGINKTEFYKQYHSNKTRWNKVFAFLRTHDLAALPLTAKTQFDGEDVMLSVTEGPDREFSKTGWESHRRFIDLLCVVTGKEKIIIADTGSLKITSPYNEAGDAAHYSGEGKEYLAEPGAFYLFFPGDAHRPNIRVEGFDTVKKVVFKIRYTD